MKQIVIYSSIFFIVLIASCKGNKKTENEVPTFLSAKEAIQLNQLIYKDSSREVFAKYAPAYEVVFIPKPVNGNYAIIAKKKTTGQYALVIRGSIIEFSNEGFQNFILQDFNIFKIRAWNYTDTVKEAYVSNGAWIGFQNLLLLRDIQTGLNIKEFIEQKVAATASVVITGHSLGGNLAYPLAGYLKKELPAEKKEHLQLITFGAPAAGNAAFVQDMEEKFPTAERYTGSKDIAAMFPDVASIGKLAKVIGLDSVLQLGKMNIYGVDADNLVSITNLILEKTNVINKTNKYVQSEKHLRQLPEKELPYSTTPLSIEEIFNKAYQFHKVDMYAELFGIGALKED